MNRIRTLIVDDEVHARRGLRMMLEGEKGIEVVGEAKNGTDAVEQIRRHRPDLVFLDVEMPELSGMEVVAAVGADTMPAVIFVTAYDQYAVAAFEANAFDYLLKPFTDERFREALARVRRAIAAPDPLAASERLQQLLVAFDQQQGAFDRFTIKTGDSLTVFSADDIDWIEADEYYTKLHIGDRTHLIRETMSALESQLPTRKFARIHRSTIVNIDKIISLEPMFQGDCMVVLKDGTRLKMSRRRREALSKNLKAFS